MTEPLFTRIKSCLCGFALGLSIFPILASAAPRAAPSIMDVISAARENGWQEGYLAGHDAAIRISQSQAARLRHLEDIEIKSRQYERCLGKLDGALYGPELYLRQVAAECAQLTKRP